VSVSPIEGWVQLELLGHRVLHGRLTVVQVGPEATGPVFLQFETPEVEGRPAELHFYSPQAVYGIHPTTEAAVIEAITPWIECGKAIDGDADDLCTLRKGHDGDCDNRLPF
jgi:hypothetical protein